MKLIPFLDFGINFLKQCKVFKFEIKKITILAKMMKLKIWILFIKIHNWVFSFWDLKIIFH